MSSSNQYLVPDAPSDAISALTFCPYPDTSRFAVASWDKHVYVYEISEGSQCMLIKKFEHRAPVLDVCFGSSKDEVYTACLDWDVRRADVSSSELSVISTHDQGVKSVVYSKAHALVVSAAWDSTLHIHPATETTWSTATINLPAKPFSLSVSSSKLIVAMATRLFHIYDLETLAKECAHDSNSLQSRFDIEPWQKRESSLKFMTRATDCMPNDEGYASSSIEGRVAVEWFNPSEESQSRKYAFKCHRQQIEDVDVVYPVNALAFHPIHGTFATGGGDGVVAIWDAVAKRRIRIYPRLSSSVAAISFSSDGKYLATAVSPGFEDGRDEISEGTVGIYIRELGETEVKRKTK